MMNYEFLEHVSKEFGDSFYVLNSRVFRTNYGELLNAYRSVYTKTDIAYPYKTNYLPLLCRIVNDLGGFAEVVSDMEYLLAKKVGVPSDKIFFNGPYKRKGAVEELLLTGGIVNIDSQYDLDMVISIARNHPNSCIKAGIRCNFDIGDGVVSRFGFDVNSSDLSEALMQLNLIDNIKIASVHCHFATRKLSTFSRRSEGMVNIIKEHFKAPPEYISIGGGLFGKMKDSLAQQFDCSIPSYDDYANESASVIRDYFKDFKNDDRPTLIIEPGSAIVGNAMQFVSRVVAIKKVRNKYIANLTGSIHNINPTLGSKNLPITIVSYDSENAPYYENLDFGGYTCIESDYLYKNYNGKLMPGDFVVFDNIGSYSIVLKPPFILPNFPILDYDETSGNMAIVKNAEGFYNIFNSYKFS